jgi:hypothetical protein
MGGLDILFLGLWIGGANVGDNGGVVRIVLLTGHCGMGVERHWRVGI